MVKWLKAYSMGIRQCVFVCRFVENPFHFPWLIPSIKITVHLTEIKRKIVTKNKMLKDVVTLKNIF